MTLLFDEDQIPLFDGAPYIPPASFASEGSQRWIQVAVNRAPDLLFDVLRPSLRLDGNSEITWRSPLEIEHFREYRDMMALRRLGIRSLPHRPLRYFWPPGGPVWDSLGRVSDGRVILLEAKAHVGEIFTPPTRARARSRFMIQQSLAEARQYFTDNSEANWCGTGYQYANRLAFQYLLQVLNEVPSHMVFLYFTNATEMYGPRSPLAWRSALRILHKRLGLTRDLRPDGVHEVFLDVSRLRSLVDEAL